MKIALAQTNIIWEDKSENINKARRMIAQAIAMECDMIFFPEMSFTGFSMNVETTGETDTYTINVMREIAKENDIAIGFGWVNLFDDKAENHYAVVSSEGELLSDYAKIHPFSYSGEDKYFSSGNEVKTFSYKGHVFSTLICYDLRFPEIFQVASANADVIVVPANWPARRAQHWNTLLNARAIENQAYILGVNCVGEIDGLQYSGCTSAYDPSGNLLGRIESTENILFVSVDDDARTVREGFPVKNDRKWGLYCKMYSEMEK